MSKFVKELMTKELSDRLEGVGGLLLVDTVGMTANDTVELRKRLREKNIQMMMIKNSLARRATEGTVLGPAFEGGGGQRSVVWGSEDVVSLAKEVIALADGSDFEKFSAIGGVMDGEALTADEVKAVSKWPSRTEMLSTLMGQVLGPAMTLSGQLLGPARTVAGQIKQKADEEGGDEG
ncbi:MAG: 50S ribosomal protein L10 [Planctomycetota bacterium]